MDPVLIFKLVELGAIMVPEDGQTHTNGFSKNLSIIQYNTPKAATSDEDPYLWIQDPSNISKKM